LLTHGDSIEKVADSFRVVAASSSFPAGVANDKLRLYGVQFHPEVGMCVSPTLMKCVSTVCMQTL
jgi:GMP synthase (glutamine-hydrolysing)